MMRRRPDPPERDAPAPRPNRWTGTRPPDQGLRSEGAPVGIALLQALWGFVLADALGSDGAPASAIAILVAGVLFLTLGLALFLCQRTRARNWGNLGLALSLLGLVGWLVTLRLPQRPPPPKHSPNPDP